MARHPHKLSWLRGVGTGVMAAATVAVLALAAVLIVVPKVMGGMSLTVLTGSMTPTIQPGDVVVTRGVDHAQAQSLQIGDVITFLPYPDDPMLVTHRIVGKTAGHDGYAFITQGDSNNVVDSWGPVQDYQIRGQLLFSVPKIGYLQQWLGSAKDWVIPAVGVGLIGYAVFGFVTSFRARRTGQPAATAGPRRALAE